MTFAPIGPYGIEDFLPMFVGYVFYLNVLKHIGIMKASDFCRLSSKELVLVLSLQHLAFETAHQDDSLFLWQIYRDLVHLGNSHEGILVFVAQGDQNGTGYPLRHHLYCLRVHHVLHCWMRIASQSRI